MGVFVSGSVGSPWRAYGVDWLNLYLCVDCPSERNGLQIFLAMGCTTLLSDVSMYPLSRKTLNQLAFASKVVVEGN